MSDRTATVAYRGFTVTLPAYVGAGEVELYRVADLELALGMDVGTLAPYVGAEVVGRAGVVEGLDAAAHLRGLRARITASDLASWT